jgi:serine/threonine-protein kinase
MRASDTVTIGYDVQGVPPQNLSPIGRLGRYELLGRLDVGGMAEIFLARESGPQGARRELVVKRVLPHVARDPVRLEMFAQEARLCMRLQHPHICPIHEFGQQDGTYFLAMEWVRGLSLRELIDRGSDFSGGLPTPVALTILADVASALHHAHTATDEHGSPLGIIHRDVSPENILVGFDGTPKLIDFGVAKAATQQHKTEAGVVKGKFAYMSPEQYRGETLDARSDVFALGCCLYEALTGESPFERPTEHETVAAITLGTETPSIREVNSTFSEELDAIVQKAIARDRNARYGSADALHQDLVDHLAQAGHVPRRAEHAQLVRELGGEEAQGWPSLDRTPLRSDPNSRTADALDETERSSLHADIDNAEQSFASSARRKRVIVMLAATFVVVVTLLASAYALQSGAQGTGSHTPTPTSPSGSSR